MNYLAEVCLLGLGVGGKYVRCLVAVFISMGFESAKRCEEGFKVLIFRGVGGGGGPRRQATNRGPIFMGELTTLYTMKGFLTM